MSSQRSGILALLLVGGYYAWRNRFRIQQFLESRGIDTPLNTSNLKDTFRSATAKISGNVDKAVRDTDSTTRQAI